MQTDTLRTEILDALDDPVDAVADLGMDATGNAPVDDAFEDAVADGTLVEFPPGEYLWRETHRFVDVDGLGLVATADADPGDVRFVTPQGEALRILNVRDDSRDVIVEGITFDQRDDYATSIGNVLQVADRGLIKDVDYAGKNPSERSGGTSSLNVYIYDPDGVAIIDGLRMAGPTELVEYPDNHMSLYCGTPSVGTLYVRHSHFENCGSSAVYASRCAGDVRIEDCYFKNNQVWQCRISGEGSWVRDSTFVWDIDDHPNDGEFQAMTGLGFESGFRGYTGGLAAGCDFICRSSAPNAGCLKVDGSHGAVTIRDCRFEVDADEAEPLWIEAPGDSHMIDGEPAEPWDVEIDGCAFAGDGGWSRPGHEAAVTIAGRSGSVLRDVAITMPNRAGLRVADGTYTLERVTFDVGGQPVIEDNATVEVAGGGDAVIDFPHELRVLGAADGVTEYWFAVDGDARLVTTGDYAAAPAGEDGVGESVSDGSTAGQTIIEGIVASGGGDTFEFDGELLAYQTLAGPDPTVTVDGEAIDLDAYRVPDEPDEPDEPDGPTREEYAQFAQTVDDALADLYGPGGA